MNPDVAANAFALVRDLAVIAAVTVMVWHHGDTTIIGAAFGILGTMIGASTATRSTRLGVQAALTPPGGSMRPPDGPRGPMGSSL